MSAQPIYVVVTSNGGAPRQGNPAGGPIVMETEADSATLDQAQHRAAAYERRFGACRVGRVVFEDHPAFNEVRGLCGEGDCHYFGQKRPSTCACSRVTP